MNTDINTDRTLVLPALPSAYHWYVVQCKSGKEKFTSDILKAYLGLIVYLPEKKIWHKGSAHYIPLFPGYFFVQINLQCTARSQINTSPGVLRLLETGGVPQKVPSCFVEALHREITRLNEYNCSPYQEFCPGETLHIVDGPLRGLEAVFVGPISARKRVQVLINFLGRLSKTVVEVTDLEKRRENNTFKRVRSTRGKGRKIRQGEE